MQMGAAQMPTAEQWKQVPRDADPAAKEAMQAMFKASFLEPGVGLGTQTFSPEAGIQREQRRRMAQGASARERMQMFNEAGVTDKEGMARVFNRAYTTPEKAFMQVQGQAGTPMARRGPGPGGPMQAAPGAATGIEWLKGR
jgi:hypothetical protein